MKVAEGIIPRKVISLLLHPSIWNSEGPYNKEVSAGYGSCLDN